LKAARAALREKQAGGRQAGGRNFRGRGHMRVYRFGKFRGLGLIGGLLVLMILGPVLLLLGLVLGVALLAAVVAGLWWWLFGKRRKGALAPAPVLRPEALRGDPLPELAGKTALWLSAEAASLPAPAAHKAQGIALRLEQLAVPLGALPEADPSVQPLRALMSDHLPELISAWSAVPPELRAAPRAAAPQGASPNAQLELGLARLEGELASLGQQSHEGALDRLAVHARYLDLRYGEGE
jgi:hypothetical protein